MTNLKDLGEGCVNAQQISLPAGMDRDSIPVILISSYSGVIVLLFMEV